MLKHFLVLALVGGLAASWGCSSHKVGGKSCSSTKACDKGSTQGQLCKSGACAGCKSDSDCTGDAYYGSGSHCVNGRCAACSPGQEGCPCDGGTCAAQLVCDSGTSKCRQPTSCTELGCQQGQTCGWAQGTSDGCLSQCDPGYQWNATTSTCDRLPTDCSTDPNDPTSILQDCNNQHRTCVAAAGTSSCGDCQTGYVASGPDCVTPVMCSDLNCAAQNRKCEGEPLASCTTCIKDYVEQNGNCRKVVTCADLNCSSTQVCVNAQDANKDGSLDTDAYCGSLSDCTAANGEVLGKDGRCAQCDCTGPGTTGTWETSDTSGSGKCVCKTQAGYFFNDAEGAVDPCDADGDGWVRDSAQTAINAGGLVAGNARCTVYRVDRVVFENEPGRLTQTASSVSVDTQTLVGEAHLDLFEPDTLDDQGLLTTSQQGNNADTKDPYGARYLKAAELNPLTKACISPLADENQNGVPDVEENSNSYPQALAHDPNLAPFVNFSYFIGLYRGYFVPDTPSESIDTSNGYYARVGSYHIQERSRLDATADGQGVDFAYDSTDPFAGGTEWASCGRAADPNLNADTSDYTTMGFEWLGTLGVDMTGFTGMNAASQFKCMEVVPDTSQLQGHYQIHKAALWDGETDATPGGNAVPDLTNGNLLYQFNACSAAPTVPQTATIPNPEDVQLSCTASKPSDLTNNTSDPLHDFSSLPIVGWVATRYLNNSKPQLNGVEDTNSFDTQPAYHAYAGGCINECANETELPATDQCPGYGTPGQACDDTRANFGLITCGCGANYGGPDCSMGCPGAELHIDPNFYVGVPTASAGYWMCGNFSATADTTMTGTGTDATGATVTYTLSGEIPVSPTASTPLNATTNKYELHGCSTANPSTCYSLTSQ